MKVTRAEGQKLTQLSQTGFSFNVRKGVFKPDENGLFESEELAQWYCFCSKRTAAIRRLTSFKGTFGRLTVIEFHSRKGRGNARYVCQCSCGNQTFSTMECLKNGSSQSCGCLIREKTSVRLRIDIPVGAKSGFLQFKKELDGKPLRVLTLCRACGKDHELLKEHFVSGRSKSCGCKRNSFKPKKDPTLIAAGYGFCTICEIDRPESAFGQRRGKRNSCCRECDAARSRAAYSKKRLV